MNLRQFQNLIAQIETGGLPEHERLTARGDGGRACGAFQMHWDWRADYWPMWAWLLLRVIDSIALENYVGKHDDLTARELCAMYNAGHPGRNPTYEAKALEACDALKLNRMDLEIPVKLE